MSKVSFDGSSKIITVTEAPVGGEVSIDCKVDIYSDWKEWVLQDDNSKYEQALRAVGGDPLPGSKALGVTYFLMNGWKIRPYEANHTLNVNGNLYCEDGSSPYIPTVGAYNVMVISAVSSLVDFTVAQLPQLEDLHDGLMGEHEFNPTTMKEIRRRKNGTLLKQFGLTAATGTVPVIVKRTPE